MTEGRSGVRDRFGIAGWWLVFVGFPAALLTLFATFFADISDYEVTRLCTAVALLCAAIGFVYGRKLGGLPWARGT
ncbi:MAG: hypothetical protein KIT85_07675 [Pseudolabrys sp.]|nr:hypothetical protein [Pseudolabrys sp.]